MSHDLSVSIHSLHPQRVAGCSRRLNLWEGWIRSDWKAEVHCGGQRFHGRDGDGGKTGKSQGTWRCGICTRFKGKSPRLNAGLAQARGEFILFTDDDVFRR